MIQPLTLEQIATHSPGEEVLGGGSASCREFDEMAQKAAMSNGTFTRDLKLLEADWVATDAGLYYVTPRVGWRWFSKWGEIERVSAGKRSRLMPTAEVLVATHYPDPQPHSQTHTWKASKTGAEMLITIATSRL